MLTGTIAIIAIAVVYMINRDTRKRELQSKLMLEDSELRMEQAIRIRVSAMTMMRTAEQIARENEK